MQFPVRMSRQRAPLRPANGARDDPEMEFMARAIKTGSNTKSEEQSGRGTSARGKQLFMNDRTRNMAMAAYGGSAPP
jgi:hypothetical protein